MGPQRAIDLTTVEEIKQATEASGFSFAAIVANRAGIRMSQALSSGELSLRELANTFTVERFVPPVKGLHKFWTSTELEEDYGGTAGKYFQREIDAIQRAVDDLPVYEAAQ